ncbi:hypothetical protein M9M90_12400 [Phenylobacterium sp. LH3H17]|uniref:hypothetical protein n=1 Tax=Phenylobacterium sp. LH3H17 TaxID=2903901 RepID=UPI0020C989BD|nr:hypothetical protein [Phenylobacterium sp. LH3H17]UTP38034.1 hypothetical protein M9M90_12400 [Phenylobacterium sp. LH3H17]
MSVPISPPPALGSGRQELPAYVANGLIGAAGARRSRWSWTAAVLWGCGPSSMRAGRRIRLRQIASVIPKAMHQASDQQAVRLAAKARSDGFEAIRAGNRKAWDEIWKDRIRLEGAGEAWQGLADAAKALLDYRGSPMLLALYGAWAARAGDRQLSLKLLDDGYGQLRRAVPPDP